jgi:hypothetical protein
MKKILHSSTLLLLAWVLSLAGLQQAHASHIQGGQLTYTNVGPNQYVVTLFLYRDCSGATLPGSMSLAVQSGCSGATAPGSPFNMNPVPNSISVGTQYCPAQQSQALCTTTATLPNYETEQYRTATITIPDGQWLLSTEICCRPSTANLSGQDNFRYEATLNNRVVVNGVNVSVRSSSPQYSALDVPVPFVYARQSTTIGFNTTDPDNTPLNIDQDSLAYSLTTPLNGCNTTVPYVAYPGSIITVVSTNPPCVSLPPVGSPANYTPTLPIHVGYNTTGTCPVVQGSTPKFAFSPSAGQFTFTPAQFNPGAPGAGLNKYVVVGRVDEYRRLPGSNRRYLIGSVRREILVIVLDGAGNTVPSPPTSNPVTPNSGTNAVNSSDSTYVELVPCNYSQVLVRFTDPDPGQILTVTYTGPGTVNNDILQGGDIGTYTLIGNGTTTPVARFLFQPSPAYAGQTLRIPFRVEDNACPTRGLQNRIVIVKIAPPRLNLSISSTTAATPGLGNTNVASICPGGSINLQTIVNRPDSTRGALQGYNVRWTGNGIVGNPNQRDVTVRPLTTTRYVVNVVPTSGFQLGACSDTTSFLVRVVPEPVAAITLPANAPSVVCAGSPVTLQGTASRGDALTDTYSYTWSGNSIPGTAISQNVTFTPTTAGVYTYTLNVAGASPYGCNSVATKQLTVLPVVQANFTVDSTAGLPPITFTFHNTSVVNGANNSAINYVWSYQRVRDVLGTPVNDPVLLTVTLPATAPSNSRPWVLPATTWCAWRQYQP